MLKDKSLSFKTIVITWAVTSFFTLVFTSIQIYFEYLDEKEQLLDTFNIVQDLYVPPLSQSLWIMNKNIIVTQADGLIGYPYVSYVKIEDDIKTYYEQGVKDDHRKTFDLNFSDTKIGELTIGLDTKFLEKKFFKRVMITVLIQGFKTIVVCIILFFAYEFIITKSLRRVSLYLETHPDLATSGKKIPYEIDREDELGILVKNLNRFIDYIFGLNKALKELNDDLEDKVNARTDLLIKKNKQLVNVIEDLENAHSQLATSEKLASLGKMTAGIAHEIKNPIYIIVNSVSLLSELLDELVESIPEETREKMDLSLKDEINDLCSRSEQSCNRVSNIINNMLSLSRGSEINKTPRNLSKLLDNSVNFSIDAFKSKNNFQAKIEKRLEDVGRIDVYSSELTRVFVNIIDNSLYSLMKKSNEVKNFEPLIKVSLEKVEDKIRIEIVDNGIGISEENLKNIFNPFFTTKPSGEGTGLGMSMAYDIIKKHGGTIDLFSTEGEGVTTKIELPNEKA